MKHEIQGELAQYVRITFGAGESCWASKGSLVSLDPAITWTLKVPGGMRGATRRMVSGEGVALTLIESTSDGQEVLLSSNEPGKIIAWDLNDGAVLTTRGSFVGAGGKDVQIDISVAKKVGVAFFGGAGLFLQKISGEGVVFIHGAGDFVEYELLDGEEVLVSTGNLAAFSARVDYDIQSVAGCRRILFGGEGLFMTKLSGPGRVLLQSLKRESKQPKGAS